ncbi:MAG: hypothetical protein CUN52_07435 [Phototrophicales bacterium]|nr:MAG: hypothetical protein CUN52_07435 [Phototrophicales bacterium]
MMWRWVAIGLIIIIGFSPISAQNAGRIPYMVYVEHDQDQFGLDHLLFVNMHTGITTQLDVYGERYTPFGYEILYLDRQTNTVMLAHPDGTTRPHPFVQMPTDAYRIDWVISQNAEMVAWTVTWRDQLGQLATITYVANADGRNLREVLREIDLANENLRALPIRFSDDLGTLYLDKHPDGIDPYLFFRQYVAVYALDLIDNTIQALPEEFGNCICGAAIGNRQFLRLRLAPDFSGFDLYLYDLNTNNRITFPPLRLNGYNTGGDILMSPDGKLAVYALAKVTPRPNQDPLTETVFVLVDFEAETQTVLTTPVQTFIRPITWTEDNSAIVFTSPRDNGTWKVVLSNGRLNRVAQTTFIGILR